MSANSKNPLILQIYGRKMSENRFSPFSLLCSTRALKVWTTGLKLEHFQLYRNWLNLAPFKLEN